MAAETTSSIFGDNVSQHRIIVPKPIKHSIPEESNGKESEQISTESETSSNYDDCDYVMPSEKRMKLRIQFTKVPRVKANPISKQNNADLEKYKK